MRRNNLNAYVDINKTNHPKAKAKNFLLELGSKIDFFCTAYFSDNAQWHERRLPEKMRAPEALWSLYNLEDQEKRI
jgi:hypothetical protein